MQGSKNTVKLMVSAALVGGQCKKRKTTTGFCIARQQQMLKHYKNQWFFEARLQKHNKTNGFSNLGWGAMQKTQ